MAQKLKTITVKTQPKNKLNKMKKTLFMLLALLISVTAFAQKNELRTAERALKSNNFNDALTTLKSIEGNISSANQKYQSKFYYLMSKALYKNGTATDLTEVGKAFNNLIDFEQKTKRERYSKEIKELLNNLIQKTAKKARATYQKAVQTKEPTDYQKAAKGYYEVYALSPKDTSFMNNAALLYLVGKDYNKAIEYYQKLLDLGFTGIATNYIASDKTTGADNFFNNKKEMDMQVKLGLYTNPRVEKQESKKAVLYKNLANAYENLKDNQKALEVLTEARKEFPKDFALLIEEANTYYRLDKKDMFKEKLNEAIKLNPNDPNLHYNVGVMNMQQKNIDAAITSFKKAVELNPNYKEAYMNLGAAYIDKANPIIEEMNQNLDNFDKYDELKAKQLEVYKLAIPYYEKAYEIDPNEIGVVQSLLGLYENLEMTEKAKQMKAKYDSLRN